ncbi:hypothetical protein FOL47_006794 [Perkinsus chesapeaki]|uniref:Uncharacterized protein n=1 Tax=Perkinsus chesapeaki TaxID=330153 RepID=A0A7J6LPF4_PERCH|nr:hypothetical protein FOL47_006794 [Perkinsus chesapeaki]
MLLKALAQPPGFYSGSVVGANSSGHEILYPLDFIIPDYTSRMVYLLIDIPDPDNGAASARRLTSPLSPGRSNVYYLGLTALNEWYRFLLANLRLNIKAGDLTTLTFTTDDSLYVTIEGRRLDFVRRALPPQAGRYIYLGKHSSDVNMVFTAQHQGSATLDLSCGRRTVPRTSFNLVKSDSLEFETYELAPRDRVARFARYVRFWCPQLGLRRSGSTNVVFTTISSLYITIGGERLDFTSL